MVTQSPKSNAESLESTKLNPDVIKIIKDMYASQVASWIIKKYSELSDWWQEMANKIILSVSDAINNNKDQFWKTAVNINFPAVNNDINLLEKKKAA